MSSRTRKLGIRHGDARLDPRWAAVAARDPRADGRFVYAVRTTGVYARPSSSARLPNPANVEFFDTAAAAEAAGYRPSRRVAGDRLGAHLPALDVGHAGRRARHPQALAAVGLLDGDIGGGGGGEAGGDESGEESAAHAVGSSGKDAHDCPV